MMRRLLPLLLLCVAEAGVLADAGPKLPLRAVYLLPGVTIGGSTSTFGEGTGYQIGGELSAVYWHKGFYTGLVIDGVYDFKRDAGRMMIGPEFGFGVIGIDGGYLVDGFGDRLNHGGAVRLFFTLGITALYVRYGALARAPDFIEWGLLIKIPLKLWGVMPPRPVRPNQPPMQPRPTGFRVLSD